MVSEANVKAELLHRYLGIRPRTSEHTALRLTVEAGVRAVGADEGSLLVFDPERHDLTFVMTYPGGEAEADLLGQRVPISGTMAGLAAETGEVQIGATRYKDAARTEAMAGVKANISAPMMLQDQLIGVITAVSKQDGKNFTMEDAELYACLATVAALIVSQTQALRSFSGADYADSPPKSLQGDSLEQEVLERIARLLQRDRTMIRQVARMLEALEAMLPGGPL